MPIIALETARLFLKPLTLETAIALVPLANNEAVTGWTARLPFPYQESDARSWFEGMDENDSPWSLHLREAENDPVGSIGLRHHGRVGTADLGYWLGEPYWNKGFVSEAARAVVDYGFNEVGLDCLRAGCNPENGATKRIFEKLGLTYVETIEEDIPARGRVEKTAYYELRSDAWRS